MTRLRPRSSHRPAPHFQRCLRTAVGVLLIVLLAGGPFVSAAQASSATMKRSLTNIIFSPVDLALSPASAGVGVYQNIQDIDDSPGVRLVYPIPGFVFALGVNIGGSLLRFVTGVLQFIPAIPLLFTEADLDSVIFSPAEDARALYENEVEISPDNWLVVRFGLNYTINDY